MSPDSGDFGRRLSRHFIPSLHDTETEIAQVSAIVDANDGAALITTAEFDIDRYSPQLGPDFDQEIRRHFTLRIERGQMTGPPAPVVTDYPLDITAGRRNRIVASFPVTRQERITATLLFAPIPFRHAVSNGFHTDESTSIKLLISQTKLSFSRGLLPDSIFDAVRTGDLDGLRALLNGNADVTALDRSGLTALALARWMQKDDIAKELATRGAPDNRSAIIFGPAAGLINVLQNDVPPQAVVSDIMAQKVILRQPATQPGASDTGARKPMSFDVHASLEPDGCDRTEINFTSSASSRDDYQTRNIGCWADNPAAFIASYAPNTSIASFDAYRLATLSPNEPGTLGATVYTAHALSGAYGAMRYSGTWPFGTTHERTARVSYTVKGTATIPACTDPGRCSVLQQIWFEERHQGDGFRTEVNVVQKGASPTPLTPGVPVQFDLSRGPVTIDLTLARDYSHLGAAYCATLQQNQLVNVYAADTFRVQPSDSIMRGTHAPFKRPIGEEYLPLTLARIDAITQSAAAFTTTLMQLPGLPPAPQLDRRPSELALAQYHDDASHPHSARC